MTTLPITFSFGDYQVLGGDGATPTEAFTKICGLSQRSLKLTSTAGETILIDCANEDAPAWPLRDVTSVSASINGQGVTTTLNAPYFRTWALAGGHRNLRVGPMNRLLADDGGYFAGSFVLISYEEGATKGVRVSITVQMDSNGPLTWVAAAS